MNAVREVLIFGRNMVHDAIVSDRQISKIIVENNIKEDQKVREIFWQADSKQILIERVRVEELNKIAEGENHQGVAAYMELPSDITLESILKDKRDAFILLFNHLDYEQNLGAIIRNAWASGVDAVVVGPSGVHEVTPVVAKISMGGAAYVPLISLSMFKAIGVLKKYAVKVIGVEVGMGADYTKTNLKGATALLFGSEALGLTEPLIKECDELVNIPMTENVASINVGMAAGIVSFEKRRQDRQ